MFYYNGGLLGINIYKLCKLLNLESIQVYGKTVDLGSKIYQKPQKTIDAVETAGYVTYANIGKENSQTLHMMYCLALKQEVVVHTTHSVYSNKILVHSR